MKLACCLVLFGLLLPEGFSQSTVPCKDLLPDNDPYAEAMGSTYVPVDSWIYPAMDRLHALGQVDTAYLGMRPWTRLSIVHMLEAASPKMEETTEDSDACRIYHAVRNELKPDIARLTEPAKPHAEVASVYTGLLGISGTPLRDSFHLGQSIVNDYGRPYQQGVNNLAASAPEWKIDDSPFISEANINIRRRRPAIHRACGVALGERRHTVRDQSEAGHDSFRTYFFRQWSSGSRSKPSYLIANHEISFGKSDHWLGPAQGGSLAWSNNAENLYAFQIDRVEPLHIPLLSRYTGPFRYQFFVGSLQGHTDPNAPWVHAEKISFKPTRNLELGFERTVIWGGKGHVPITVHSFLKSFFSFQNVSAAEKLSRDDPGARFGTFDFSYRLPYLRQWLTLYTDSLSHDDTSPISAPRRAGIRPGLYLSHFPKLHALDLRVEAADTDPETSRSNAGQFLYWEQIQKQGYTNKGFIMGDWIGRESKGGQAWLTYHLSPREQIQISYRNAKAAKDFIPGGTTQNDFQISATKRIHEHFELKGSIQYEGWKAPVYKANKQSDVSTSAQITWYPR